MSAHERPRCTHLFRSLPDTARSTSSRRRASAATMDGDPPSALQRYQASFDRQFQYLVDKSTVHVKLRWVGFLCTLALYALRVFLINGWYIVTYGLGIYLLNNFIGFLSPMIDPENEGPTLPTSGSEEYRPFSRRLPEFKFWYASVKAVFTAFMMTFFTVFDIPVFWPILLLYFVALLFLTMKRQIRHMIKHKYVPWSWGKAKYKAGAKAAGKNSE